MSLFKTFLRYKQGHQTETTEADVCAMLADETERQRLEKEARETIMLVRKLVQRNPREAAYTIVAGNDTGDVIMSYYLALTLVWWMQPLYDILKGSPIIGEMEAQRLAARQDGTLMTVHEVTR